MVTQIAVFVRPTHGYGVVSWYGVDSLFVAELASVFLEKEKMQ